MNRIEPLWELVQRERLLQWTAVVAFALAWFAAAWTDPTPLVVLVVLLGGVYLYRRHRGPIDDDDLELL